MSTQDATAIRPLDLNKLRLGHGSHTNPGDKPPINEESCLLEACAWMAGEKWSDHPKCVSPVLGTMGRSLNDLVSFDKRQRLVPLIPAMLDTAGDGLEETRSFMALDWLIRTYTPAWLDLAGMNAEATALRDLRRIVDLVSAQAAGPVVREAQHRAAAAWAAAWAAAGAAAWAAAGAAARAAARAAAGDAAGDAAGAAAGDAAGDAARAAARAAARDAARAAARAAARDAARAAAWAAAWAAAGDALKPTVEQLQESAIDLFTQMVQPTAGA